MKSLCTTALLSLLAAASASGQRDTLDIFPLNDKEWASKEDFIRNGGRCSTSAPTEAELGLDEEIRATAKASGRLAAAGTFVTVPVYVHVIHNGANGNVSDASIASWMNVLNNAYAPHGFGFQLIATDRTNVSGSRTRATWYTMQPGTTAEAQAKAALRKGGKDTLNLYTANIGAGMLGWSSSPFQLDTRLNDDGVVMLYSTLPGGSAAPYNLGHQTVHEVGHWLGLYHTFQGGCTGTNDAVWDTPRERYASFGCPVGRNTCTQDPGNDSIHNYMNYTDDACMNQFTPGQATRMQEKWVMYRAN